MKRKSIPKEMEDLLNDARVEAYYEGLRKQCEDSDLDKMLIIQIVKKFLYDIESEFQRDLFDLSSLPSVDDLDL